MIVPYSPSDSDAFHREYYNMQAGYGMTVFKGKDIMRGSGIGSFIGSIARSALPFLKKGATLAGKNCYLPVPLLWVML